MGQGLLLDCDSNRMEALTVLWIKDHCYPAKEFHHTTPLLNEAYPKKDLCLSYHCRLWSFIS